MAYGSVFLEKGGMMKRHIYLKDVVTLELQRDKCIGCGMCVNVCPHGVFDTNIDMDMDGKKAVITDRDACMECGACALNCPVQAIDVRSGVGCAHAIIKGSIQGKEPYCGEECRPTEACC